MFSWDPFQPLWFCGNTPIAAYTLMVSPAHAEVPHACTQDCLAMHSPLLTFIITPLRVVALAACTSAPVGVWEHFRLSCPDLLSIAWQLNAVLFINMHLGRSVLPGLLSMKCQLCIFKAVIPFSDFVCLYILKENKTTTQMNCVVSCIVPVF